MSSPPNPSISLLSLFFFSPATSRPMGDLPLIQIEELVEEKHALREDLAAEQRFNQELGAIINTLRTHSARAGTAARKSPGFSQPGSSE